MTSNDALDYVPPPPDSTNAKLQKFTTRLSRELKGVRSRLYAPKSSKTFDRTFSTQDLSRLLGVPESTLRALTLEGRGPQPDRHENGRRYYTLEQVSKLREYLASIRPDDALRLMPRRREGEPLQVIAACNFKGGSAKTSTSLHIAHYLALQGYRVLCVDLDPQASLTSLFGYQPEFDFVGENTTAWGALRYDSKQVPLSKIIIPTYFHNISLVPANTELMNFEFETPLFLKHRDALGLFYGRLRRVLAEVENDYDVVVIDTLPSLGYLSFAAIYASTGIIITTQAAMIDVASVNQYLIMLNDFASVFYGSGTGPLLDIDFVKFLVTRYVPQDQAQKSVAAFLRHVFPDDVLVNEVLQSAAISAAGLMKRSLYEMDQSAKGESPVGREAFKRALESVDAVNAEILGLILKSWGRT